MKFLFGLSGLILLIIIWLVLDFRLGRKKQLSKVRPRKTVLLHGDFQIFTRGKELFADYFEEIRKAEKHIHILFYIVKNDAFGQEFLGLIKEKAQQGVKVRLLVDRLGSIQLKKPETKALREAGVDFCFSNRIQLPYLFYSSQVRNHRKITVIDGEIGYLGGYNVGKEYIDEKPKLSPWRDYHLKITGESVNTLQREFLMDWKQYADEDLLENQDFFPPLAKGTVAHQYNPTEARLLEDSFLRLFAEARTSILIGSPYFIPTRRIFDALLHAIARGVDITILVPNRADHPFVQEASYPYLRRLLRKGVHVFQYKNGFYHAKTTVIDDRMCDIGTANFDKRSFFLNKEMNCFVYDAAFIAHLKGIIEHDIKKHSDPLPLEKLTKFNPWRTVKEWVASAISYFL